MVHVYQRKADRVETRMVSPTKGLQCSDPGIVAEPSFYIAIKVPYHHGGAEVGNDMPNGMKTMSSRLLLIDSAKQGEIGVCIGK